MKSVAAALGNKINHRTLGLPVLSTETVAFNTKLFNRVDRGKDQQRGIRSHVHVINAVDCPHVSVRLVAVNRHIDVRIEPGTLSAESAARTRLSNWRNPRNHGRQLRVISTVQRKFSNLLLSNQTTDRAGASFDLNTLAHDIDCFRDLAHLQLEIKYFVLADMDVYGIVDRLLEAGCRHSERILPSRNAGGGIMSIVV